MSVFHDIKSLKLRASYGTVVAEVTLNDVQMDAAVDGPLVGAVRAKSVERCECPAKATGESCEVSYNASKQSCAKTEDVIQCNIRF